MVNVRNDAEVPDDGRICCGGHRGGAGHGRHAGSLLLALPRRFTGAGLVSHPATCRISEPIVSHVRARASALQPAVRSRPAVHSAAIHSEPHRICSCGALPEAGAGWPGGIVAAMALNFRSHRQRSPQHTALPRRLARPQAPRHGAGSKPDRQSGARTALPERPADGRGPGRHRRGLTGTYPGDFHGTATVAMPPPPTAGPIPARSCGPGCPTKRTTRGARTARCCWWAASGRYLLGLMLTSKDHDGDARRARRLRRHRHRPLGPAVAPQRGQAGPHSADRPAGHPARRCHPGRRTSFSVDRRRLLQSAATAGR